MKGILARDLAVAAFALGTSAANAVPIHLDFTGTVTVTTARDVVRGAGTRDVPEPGTFALFGAALGGMLIFHRRKSSTI
ncbi:MAG TPA: PEP-CTERM sorting domain-containing protein [Steroidobacteraceae bacterium]|nr:PEP-CTERM sorting domain-containing protein [Steroidobacteraceae bacterium]